MRRKGARTVTCRAPMLQTTRSYSQFYILTYSGQTHSPIPSLWSVGQIQNPCSEVLLHPCALHLVPQKYGAQLTVMTFRQWVKGQGSRVTSYQQCVIKLYLKHSHLLIYWQYLCFRSAPMLYVCLWFFRGEMKAEELRIHLD